MDAKPLGNTLKDPSTDALPIIDVVAGIIWQDGHYLAAQRPLDKPHGGFWEFPGGKMEAGESPEQALQRELGEELGVVPSKVQFWQSFEHSYPQRRVRLYFFHVFEFQGKISSNEGQEVRWVTPKEAVHLNFLEADKALVYSLSLRS